MGFFSTRKADDHDSYTATATATASGDKSSVAQVIRSRLYGKKGKEREEPPSYLASFSAAARSQPAAQNPVASAPPTPGKAGPSILRADLDRPLPSLPGTPTKRRPAVTTEPPTTPVRSPSKPAGSHSKKQSTSSSSSPRKNIDTVTATLAQRLNALAVANSDGLLNDDEYRLLRQNLFERFSSNAAVPTETPVVPLTAPQPRPRKVGLTPDRPSSRPLSNFQVERPISVASRSSVAGMADILRRATGKKSGSKDVSDTASVWSSTSKQSFFRLPRGLRKKDSNSSMHTTSSRIPADQISLSSKGPTSDRGHGDTLVSPTSRSAASIRSLAAPPSSFPGGRKVGQEHRNTSSIYDVFHEDHLQSVKDIKQEILNIEAESKRLMDAFNGLEVTTLAKTQRHRSRPSPVLKSCTAGSNWGADSDGLSQRRVVLADDAMSVRSGTSIGTSPSAYSTMKTTRVKIATSSIHRKNSLSSVTSDRRGKMLPPPMPAIPNSISHGHLRAASTSNISLVRSTGHLPMNTVLEDENMSVDEEDETELDDIQRRREEVSQRYDARLEYLRAKLKGAQLHEKLMRK